MTEKSIEQRFIKDVKKHGGLALKFVSPGTNGMPDRLVVFPGNRMFLAELKKPGKKPSPVQVAVHGVLYKFGVKVYVIDSVEAIKIFITETKVLNL